MKQKMKHDQSSRLWKLISSCFTPKVAGDSKDEPPSPSWPSSETQLDNTLNKTSVSFRVDSLDSSHGSIRKEIEATTQEEITTSTKQVVIPDMFRSFMAVTPVVNPWYKLVKAKSEAWIFEKLNGDTKSCKRISKTDFALFAAIAAPDAAENELQVLCDWGNWVFPFDDLFDNGILKDDTLMAQAMMKQLLDGMSSQDNQTTSHLPKHPLLEIHDEIWSRINQGAYKGVQKRFKLAMENYCQGVLEHVDHITISKTPSITEYMTARRRGVGVEPVIALVEYAQGIAIPEDVYHHNALQELRRIVTDMILLQNDILSYCKEQSEGVAHNIITVLRANGMTTQQAFDHTSELLNEGYRDWYLAQARLSQWGEEVDAAVQKYISALHSIMLASLHWHFNSDRYFGSRKEEVRKHRTITVSENTLKG